MSSSDTPRPGLPASILVTLFVGLLAVAACAGPGASPSLIRESWPTTLNATTWQAVAIGPAPAIAGRQPTLTFTADQASGSTGCNQFSGPYRYAAGVIAFGDLIATKIGCDGPIADAEQRFLAALQGAKSASIDEVGRLVLGGDGGTVILEVGPVLIEG